MMRRLRPLLLLALLALAGCGWHLRGPVALDNLPAITLTGGSNALRYQLMNQLMDSGILVSDVAPLTLRLVNEEWSQRTAVVNSAGRVVALELSYQLVWQLERDGKTLAPVQRIHLISNVNQDPVNATAASDELDLGKQAMRQDAIWQLQRQLQSISEHQDLTSHGDAGHATQD